MRNVRWNKRKEMCRGGKSVTVGTEALRSSGNMHCNHLNVRLRVMEHKTQSHYKMMKGTIQQEDTTIATLVCMYMLLERLNI